MLFDLMVCLESSVAAAAGWRWRYFKDEDRCGGTYPDVLDDVVVWLPVGGGKLMDLRLLLRRSDGGGLEGGGGKVMNRGANCNVRFLFCAYSLNGSSSTVNVSNVWIRFIREPTEYRFDVLASVFPQFLKGNSGSLGAVFSLISTENSISNKFINSLAMFCTIELLGSTPVSLVQLSRFLFRKDAVWLFRRP